jgi:hypothetical protein
MRAGANRRKLSRHRTDMNVTVRLWRPWGGWRPVIRDARALDYNRFGMAFNSRRAVRPDRKLRLSLYGPGMTLKGVSARVVSCQRVGGGYRIGVRFYDSLRELSDGPMPLSMRYLGGLEQEVAGEDSVSF